MGITGKGFWWEFKNSLWILYLLLPLCSAAPFFYMSARVEEKSFKRLGYAYLWLTLGLFLGIFFGIITDYSDWSGVCMLLLFLLKGIAWIQSLIARPKYLKLLADKQDRIASFSNMNNMGYNYGYVPQSYVPQQYDQNTNIQRFLPPQQNAMLTVNTSEAVHGSCNINTCTEDELAALPGLNIIDAKKAVSHRELNGDFSSVEEFIMLLNIKPHIAVKLYDILVCEASSDETAMIETPPPPTNGRRTLDF